MTENALPPGFKRARDLKVGDVAQGCLVVGLPAAAIVPGWVVVAVRRGQATAQLCWHRDHTVPLGYELPTKEATEALLRCLAGGKP